MRNRKLAAVLLVLCLFGMLLGSSLAQNQKTQKAQNIVNQAKPADPPKATGGSKPSPVGQPATTAGKNIGYKPAQKSPESKKIVVPPPAKSK